MMKRQRIKRELRKFKNYYNPIPKSTKEERRKIFLLNCNHSKHVTNLADKLRCQIKGCHDGAITFRRKIKVCDRCNKVLYQS
jgi:hypothetical protein